MPASFEPIMSANGDAAQPGMAPHETGTTGVVEIDGTAGMTDAIVTNTTRTASVVGTDATSVTSVAGGGDMTSNAASVTNVVGGSDIASNAVNVTGVTSGNDMASDVAEVTGATQGFRHLHLGSYSALTPSGARKLVTLLDIKTTAPGLTVSYDPNMCPALVDDLVVTHATVETIVTRTNVVEVSDEDLEFLYPEVVAGQIAAQQLAVRP